VSDKSGNSNTGTPTVDNGTLKNMESGDWLSGSNCHSGSCLNFDGVDEYVNIPDDDSLDGYKNITIEAWINQIQLGEERHSFQKE
jgi:hypothetical protein